MESILLFKPIECVNEIKETFGLKSEKCPPPCSDLTPFDKDLLDMVISLKFRHVKDSFQREFSQDIRKIESSPNAFVFADKTNNIYVISNDHHKKVLHDNVTKTYQSALTKLEAYQWRNTDAVLKWFNNITNKSNCGFIQFDIKEFYPSITEKIPHQTSKFAKATYKN